MGRAHDNDGFVPLGEIRSHRDLVAWQHARSLVHEVYSATATFPEHERFGLTNQLRRCAVSIPSNIAEGYGRGSRQDYLRFLRTARGSLCELDTQSLLAHDLHFLADAAYTRLQEAIRRTEMVLAGLIRSLR